MFMFSRPLAVITAMPRSAAKRTSDGVIRSRGFSLVELMVAMVIGLLSIIIMMQMLGKYEQQKRTTTSGDDSLSSGAIALSGLERDIRQAGLGFMSVQVIGCNITGLISGGAQFPLVPIMINPGGASWGDTGDTVLITSGNANGAGEGNLINSLPASAYDVQAPSMFVTGEKVFAAPENRLSTCLLDLQNVTDIQQSNIVVGTQYATMLGGRLYSLGTKPSVTAYAVKNGNLAVCDHMANDCSTGGTWVPIADNVVSLQAQYGFDTNVPLMDGVIDVWDTTDASITSLGVPIGGPQYTNACQTLRMAAVRVALIARSSQPEKTPDWPNLNTHITPVAPTWLGSAASAPSGAPETLTASPITVPVVSETWPTWQDFRYRVFETVIPLRNVTSQGVVSKC
ncbi:MAG: hypothetical protein RLZZ298_1149 [Pseudomonadota bacterium]